MTKNKEFVLRDVIVRLDNLSGRMNQGFEAVDKRFEAVDKRFESIDKRFDSIDKRFETIDKRFEAMDKRFDKIDQRIDVLEMHIDSEIADLAGMVQREFDAQNKMIHQRRTAVALR